MSRDFEEVSHSGGKITFSIKTDEDGRQAYQVKLSHSRSVPHSLVGVYALPVGVVVSCIELRGIGQPWNPPPFSGCLPVLMASDSEGYFGHTCPHCEGYWRSGPWPYCCPYCGALSAPYEFLSEAQLRYVKHYCKTLLEALQSRDNGEVEIDMDIVADAACKGGERPSFYVSEESQQKKFNCSACNEFNDILGIFGYCSQCGTRNDLIEFESSVVPEIRAQLNAGSTPEDCLRDAVASFESFTRQVGVQLANLVPMSRRRKQRLLKQRYHDLADVAEILLTWFDIDMFSGIPEDERARTTAMFHRRHVYEHSAGEVDQKYLDDSGDTTVRLKQHIHETREDVHDLIGSLLKMFRNLHHGFHEIVPPHDEPIKAFEARSIRTAT